MIEAMIAQQRSGVDLDLGGFAELAEASGYREGQVRTRLVEVDR
jgi:hypothetical protein